MTYLRKALACSLVLMMIASQSVVFANTSNPLDIYDQIVKSQGQVGALDPDMVGQVILPDGVSSPTWDGTINETTEETTPETPDTTEPGTSDPGTTAPEPTEPDTSTPEPSEPEPSEPTPEPTPTPTPTPEPEPTPTMKTQTITMSQRYNSTFDVYEFSANNKYYIYTNVENGGIVATSCYVDIPYNVTYKLEKDGLATSYTRNETISDLGSYMFTFTLTDYEEMTKYVSTLRFRIEEPVSGGGVSSGDNPFVDGSYIIDPETGEILPATDSDIDWGDLLDDLEGETLEPDEETLEPSEEEEFPPALRSTYEEGSGYYKNLLYTDGYFWSNVPQGTYTNSSVTFRAGEGEIEYAVYRDGEAIDFSIGSTVREPGSYVIFPSENVTHMLGDWVPPNRASFSFTIMASDIPINSSVIPLPLSAGVSLVDVQLEGESVRHAQMEDHITLAEDGEYTITLVAPAGESVFTFVRDTIAPIFTVDTSEKNIATIQIISDDVVLCELYEEGELVREAASLRSVSGEGDYTLKLYDKAGNMTEQNFTVEYGLNTGAIMAVFLVIALCIGVFFAIKRMRSKVSVR